MNRLQIREEIRRLIRDTATDPASQKFSDTVLNSRMNEVQEEMCSIAAMLPSRASVNLVASTREYTLPDYYLAITAVYLKDSSGDYKPLTKATESELSLLDVDWRDDSNTSDRPTYYYLRRSVIGLYPMPSVSRTSGLQIDLIRRPDQMDEDTDIPFENNYKYYSAHMGLVYGVCKICKAADGKFDESEVFESKYGLKIKEILRELSRDNELTRIPNIYESARTGARRTC